MFHIWENNIVFSSVQFSRSVVSDSLRPHGLQHARPPCPSPTPGAYSNSCPSSWWWHPPNHLILCRPLLLLPSVFPSIWVFSSESDLLIRWTKDWNFSFSISPFNEYSGLISFRIDWWISLQSKGLSRVFPNTTVQKFKNNYYSDNFLVPPLRSLFSPLINTFQNGKIVFLWFKWHCFVD